MGKTQGQLYSPNKPISKSLTNTSNGQYNTQTQELTMRGRNTLNLLLLYTVYHEANKTLKIAQLKSKTKGRYFITQENTYVDKNQD